VLTKEKILEALQDVKDPEIPTISVVELGIVTDVHISDNNSVSIILTPTFAGCPALKMMELLVKAKVEELNPAGIRVITTFDKPWNTNMITEKGREMLKKHGLAPPPKLDIPIQINILTHVNCPHCGSIDTKLNTPFGPTLCRSMHYCNNCLQAFEQFKPVS